MAKKPVVIHTMKTVKDFKTERDMQKAGNWVNKPNQSSRDWDYTLPVSKGGPRSSIGRIGSLDDNYGNPSQVTSGGRGVGAYMPALRQYTKGSVTPERQSLDLIADKHQLSKSIKKRAAPIPKISTEQKTMADPVDLLSGHTMAKSMPYRSDRTAMPRDAANPKSINTGAEVLQRRAKSLKKDIDSGFVPSIGVKTSNESDMQSSVFPKKKKRK